MTKHFSAYDQNGSLIIEGGTAKQTAEAMIKDAGHAYSIEPDPESGEYNYLDMYIMANGVKKKVAHWLESEEDGYYHILYGGYRGAWVVEC